jgi:hypothetical protein
MTKLADPVHFFDQYGSSVLTNEYLLKRIIELETRVEKLKTLLEAAIRAKNAIS